MSDAKGRGDIVAQAREHLAADTAQSVANILIAYMVEEIEWLRGAEIERLRAARDKFDLEAQKLSAEVERLNGCILIGMAQLRELRAENEELARVLRREAEAHSAAVARYAAAEKEIEQLRVLLQEAQQLIEEDAETADWFKSTRRALEGK
jgi:chromosome segregation ATPase